MTYYGTVNASVLPDLERAVGRDGQAGFKPFLRDLRAVECAWPDDAPAGEPPPFFNINDPAALVQAGRWMERGIAMGGTC